jgi:hypothetical protein
LGVRLLSFLKLFLNASDTLHEKQWLCVRDEILYEFRDPHKPAENLIQQDNAHEKSWGINDVQSENLNHQQLTSLLWWQNWPLYLPESHSFSILFDSISALGMWYVQRYAPAGIRC